MGKVNPHNPVLEPTGFNVGIGHADMLIVDGVTMMYTQTGEQTLRALCAQVEVR